ncbi:MAG: Glu/Leu/Phe/Val dehydrogenase [Candidatus Pacebacteria bacterium]|nr:Glu/Leu/Phe/Val dehydrogenase [Candidatus Paceibacterota bacterium]
MGQTNQLLSTAVANLEAAAGRLRLKPHMLERVATPKEKIEIAINPILDDDQPVPITAFIVRHNDALGPAKGGIRMSPTVTLDDVAGMAMEMTWKTALIGVPFGGGKSGIRFDGSAVSQAAKEKIIRSFTRGARRHFGPELYIPAPDMGTNERDMGHIRDCISYSDGTSITQGCFVTGKPVMLGGIVGRREATGKGVVYSTAAACSEMGLDLKTVKVAVQGFGNVGSVTAKEIFDLGARVIAVSDIHGGIYSERGLNIDDVLDHVQRTGSLTDVPGSEFIDNEELLACSCDVLIPAATQSQITEENADRIQARIIAEGANAPTTPAGDEILRGKGILVIPDILCNAGGVFVSYLEYTQETQREQMTEEQVEERLRKRMSDRFKQVCEYARGKDCTMREAAMDLAVGRVVEAIESRGLLP